jgi:hypothetical protein
LVSVLSYLLLHKPTIKATLIGLLVNCCCMFHGLCPLACSGSELTSESMNTFRFIGRIPWTGDRLVAVPLPIQDSTTQKNAGIHPLLEWDSNP